MRLHRSTRRLMSWIATLAILISAMAPTMSLAFASSLGMDMTEVCTAMTDDSTERVGPSSSPAAGMVDCKLCMNRHLGPDLAGLPPAPQSVVLLVALRQPVPTLFLSAPRTLHAWTTAQPRAPPLNA